MSSIINLATNYDKQKSFFLGSGEARTGRADGCHDVFRGAGPC